MSPVDIIWSNLLAFLEKISLQVQYLAKLEST